METRVKAEAAAAVAEEQYKYRLWKVFSSLSLPAKSGSGVLHYCERVFPAGVGQLDRRRVREG